MKAAEAEPRAGRRFAWGAEMLSPAEASFRVWAPGARSLMLWLNGTSLPMASGGDGWFEVRAQVPTGSAYMFELPDGTRLPDPASRAQAGDVHGPSLLTDTQAYAWRNGGWAGRPWEEAAVYELHVGTFTQEGTFAAAAQRLGHLAELGVTAVELMPVAQFSGDRGWGYDGVLAYAPHRAYGTPDDLKRLVDAAHGLGLMVLLDVVYNHFGPDGNYLSLLAPAFFDPNRHTPWGAAIAYEREPVRRFFSDNAVYWLEEFRLDGLRFDAIDQIRDSSVPDILTEIALRIRTEIPDRSIHLTTEDNRNVTHLHRRDEAGLAALFTAEWNDDFHNAAHVIATGETDSYYEDFADDPVRKLARALAEGFAYQGEPSPHAQGARRGQPSAHLPPTAFLDFLQNHDQIGNRAQGERLTVLVSPERLRALAAILHLSPHIPFMFMGEEWGETRPFRFFTDFHGELADAVRQGRRREFSKFKAFGDEHARQSIPDPNAGSTFADSKIDWSRRDSADGRAWLDFTRRMLALRREWIVPLMPGAGGNSGRALDAAEGVLAVDWELMGGRLQLRANFGPREASFPEITGEIVHAEPQRARGAGGSTLAVDAVLVGLERRPR